MPPVLAWVLMPSVLAWVLTAWVQARRLEEVEQRGTVSVEEYPRARWGLCLLCHGHQSKLL
jgi:hypothetical protein